MEAISFDRSRGGLTQSTGRRSAIQTLGTIGMALIAALGRGDASAKQHDAHGGNDGGRHRADRGGRRGRNEDRPKTSPRHGASTTDEQSADDPAGPAGPDGVAADAGGEIQTEGKRKTKRGPTGPTGPTGPSPATITRFGPTKRETGIFVNSVARCEPGEHAVGGGYFLSLEDTGQIIDFVASVPDPFTDGTVPTGWSAEANAVFPGGEKEIRAFVVCVPD